MNSDQSPASVDVSRLASERDFRQALAQHHTDRGGDIEVFVAIAEARDRWRKTNRPCLKCGRAVPPTNAKYCSRACASKHVMLARRHKRIGPRPRPKVCPCGKTFEARWNRSKYCSRVCYRRQQVIYARQWTRRHKGFGGFVATPALVEGALDTGGTKAQMPESLT